MKKATQYRLISGRDGTVAGEINQLLDQGWTVHGSPAIQIDEEERVFVVQAMVMYEDD